MKTLKFGDKVKILPYQNDPKNQYGVVRCVYDCGKIWVSNLNSPYNGTVSELFVKDELEKR